MVCTPSASNGLRALSSRKRGIGHCIVSLCIAASVYSTEGYLCPLFGSHAETSRRFLRRGRTGVSDGAMFPNARFCPSGYNLAKGAPCRGLTRAERAEYYGRPPHRARVYAGCESTRRTRPSIEWMALRPPYPLHTGSRGDPHCPLSRPDDICESRSQPVVANFEGCVRKKHNVSIGEIIDIRRT